MTGPRLDPSDWARITEVFHRALEQPASERPAWLDATCPDPALRAEVASLLAAHERSSGFMDSPAGSADRLLREALEDDHHASGAMVGAYRVERLLGEGGMGVVYRAEDTRLGRTVALKALPRRFATDPTRRERLKREARAAAALTHPNIATVYALEEIDDQLYIASEFIPGETLRDEIRRGPLPIARAIDTVLAIAHALAAAHDRGIVHRDLKPENVMRQPDGRVKVLDFGLARTRDSGSPAMPLTGDGNVLGTPAYMSPEQIRGSDVDGRSDLFAVGVILYELATGVHPFQPDDSPAVLARILETDPPPLAERAQAAGADPVLARMVDVIARTCLRKAPGDRYSGAHALAAALESMRTEAGRQSSGSGARSVVLDGPAPSPLWWWQFHQGAASAASVALVLLLWHARGARPGFWTLAVFLAGLAAAIGGIALRLHLWFASRQYREGVGGVLESSTGLIRAADGLFVAALLADGLLVVADHSALGALLIAAAVAVLVSSAVIEPATTRAAFRSPESAP